MKVLVVHAHPCEESFNTALRDRVVSALERAGHEVRVADLYRENFDPVMGADERRRYHDPGENEKPVAGELERLMWADGLVFVYPTWWFGLPAILKGWLDRVFVPHVTFTMPPGPDGLKGRLDHIRAISAVTTCGATWIVSKLMGEPGRRTLLRGIRALCNRRCKTRYHALYQMDTVSAYARTRYLADVEAAMSRFGR